MLVRFEGLESVIDREPQSGSHKGPAILIHVETYAEDIPLSRGQEIENIDDTGAVVVLRAGEFSIHHNKTIHSTEPNSSDQARISFSVHIAPPRGDMGTNCLVALGGAWDQYRRAMKTPFEQ